MADILLVASKKSFTVTSLSKMLEEQDAPVVHTTFDPSEIGKVQSGIRAIIINAEEYSMDGVIFIKDLVIEEEKPIFIFGDINQVQEIEGIIPNQFVKKKFIRPFNLKEVEEEIMRYISDDANFSKKKILVVDDSGTMLRNVKGWLEDKYQVILANSGAMAIKFLAISRPDLILLDYEMPICDGKQVLEMIRAEHEYADIPVMFLTNKNDKESVMQVSSLKPEGYLLKTMEPEQIIQSIDTFFEQSKWKM